MYVYRGIFDFPSDGTDQDYVARNEQIIVIFPNNFRIDQPVNVYWQWTSHPRYGAKEATVSGLINSACYTERDGLSLRFCYDEEYQFDAIVGRLSYTELLLVVKTANGQRSLQYQLDQFNLIDGAPLVPLPELYNGHTPSDAGCTIYTGISDDGTYKKMFLFVSPMGPLQEGQGIVVMWQLPTGMMKDTVIRFAGGKNREYRFTATLDGIAEFLEWSVEGPDWEDKLQFRSFFSEFQARRRAKRGISNIAKFSPGWKTSTVRNDTEDAFICELVESGTAAQVESLVYGLIGEAVGFFGVIIGISNLKVKAAKQFAYAIGGLAFSTITLWDGTREAPEERRGLLFPGDDMTRTSQISLSSDNDVHIIKTYIESDNIFVSSRGKKELLGRKEWKFSEMEIEWEKPLKVPLADRRRCHVEACSLIQICGFELNSTGRRMTGGEIDQVIRDRSGSMYSTNSTNWFPLQYGVWDPKETTLKQNSGKNSAVIGYLQDEILEIKPWVGQMRAYVWVEVDGCFWFQRMRYNDDP